MPRQLTPVVGIEATFLEPSQPPLIAGAVSAPVVTVAIQKRPRPGRSLSDWNSGGFVAATESSQWIQSASFLPSAPIRAIQKGSQLRSASDAGINPAVNRYGTQWIQSPQFNSGGLTPVVLLARQKTRPFRANSRILIATPAVVLPGAAPIVSRAIQKPRTPKANSRLQIAPIYNSGGLVPVVLRATQKRSPTRGSSRARPAPQFNSGGLSPTVLKAAQKPKPFRANSRSLPAPKFNSGGLIPTVLKAVQKTRPVRGASRFIIATPTVILPGTRPTVSRAVQKPRIPRSNSRLQIAPRFNSGGIKPIVRVALRRPPAKPVLPRFVIAPLPYVPVFIRPNPLAFPLSANPIALPGQQGSSGNAIYGIAIYGINAFGQVQVSSLAIPLIATARANSVV